MGKSKFSEGDTCAICDKPWVAGKKYANHHVSYDKDITVVLCYTCHALLHGSAKIYNHPFKGLGRDTGPRMFAKRVVKMYDALLEAEEWEEAYQKWFKKQLEKPGKSDGGGGDV